MSDDIDIEMNRAKSLNAWAAEIHEWSTSNGWWLRATDNIAGKLLLVHSEISEAAEELRDARPNPHGYPEVDFDDLRRTLYDEGSPGMTVLLPTPRSSDGSPLKPVGFPSELADAIIRILDICARVGIDIDEIMRVKMDYNKTRSHRHGGRSL
jgi:hypothetical protein